VALDRVKSRSPHQRKSMVEEHPTSAPDPPPPPSSPSALALSSPPVISMAATFTSPPQQWQEQQPQWRRWGSGAIVVGLSLHVSAVSIVVVEALIFYCSICKIMSAIQLSFALVDYDRTTEEALLMRIDTRSTTLHGLKKLKEESATTRPTIRKILEDHVLLSKT
jgi:hypothetical protein